MDRNVHTAVCVTCILFPYVRGRRSGALPTAPGCPLYQPACPPAVTELTALAA